MDVLAHLALVPLQPAVARHEHPARRAEQDALRIGGIDEDRLARRPQDALPRAAGIVGPPEPPDGPDEDRARPVAHHGHGEHPRRRRGGQRRQRRPARGCHPVDGPSRGNVERPVQPRGDHGAGDPGRKGPEDAQVPGGLEGAPGEDEGRGAVRRHEDRLPGDVGGGQPGLPVRALQDAAGSPDQEAPMDGCEGQDRVAAGNGALDAPVRQDHQHQGPQEQHTHPDPHVLDAAVPAPARLVTPTRRLGRIHHQVATIR